MTLSQKVQTHFIDSDDGKMVSRLLFNRVPRTGDTARFSNKNGEIYYKIVEVIWVYDEPDCPAERVNIAIEKIEVMNETM